MHTLIQTFRQRIPLSGPDKGKKTDVEVVFHASSLQIDERHGVGFFANAIRKEWTVENGYHAKRDGAYCEDLRTRRCNENVTGAMLLARTPVFVFLAHGQTDNTQEFKEEMQRDYCKALNFLLKPLSN